METAGLKHRLDLLPRELYDYIYCLTFVNTGDYAAIDTDYQPPSNLQVSRKTRIAATLHHYASTEFCFDDHRLCLKWLLSLSKEHLSMLRSVRCESTSGSWGLDMFNYEAKMHRAYVLNELRVRGVDVDASVLHFTILGRDGEEGECRTQ